MQFLPTLSLFLFVFAAAGTPAPRSKCSEVQETHRLTPRHDHSMYCSSLLSRLVALLLDLFASATKPGTER